MAASGAFTFVLHSHIPYVRLAGRWPHGEEWVHEAAVETYIPLLNTLYDLKAESIPFKLTLGITPVLAEQLTDPLVLEHLDGYLTMRINAAARDMQHFETAEHANPHLRYLAEWYHDIYQKTQVSFQERFQRDIIGAFRRLQDEGFIEIIGGAATHAYLPLLSRDSSIRAQIKAGVASYRRVFGRSPRSIWLPECAYRPAFYQENGQMRPGLERFLADEGIKLFFGETHAITGGQPVGMTGGDVIGPYGNVKRRYVLPLHTVEITPQREATTFTPYFVADTSAGPDSKVHSGVAVIGRNNRTGQQVWSAEWGYPGDYDYREFHKKASTSGLQYWRVTGKKVDLADKDVYQPTWAASKTDQHAEHYAHLVGDLIRDHARSTKSYGVVASSYDTELFGHWWFEGISWLGKVLRYLAADKQVDLTTASEFLEQHPPTDVLNIPESSWGAGGGDFVWDNPDNRWMWAPIYEAEARIEALAARFPNPDPKTRAALNQAARELMLGQSSDWQFQVTTGQARDYAVERFNQHLERFNQLASQIESGTVDADLTEELYERDKVFPDIDYRWFAP